MTAPNIVDGWRRSLLRLGDEPRAAVKGSFHPKANR
jgi:hypothetical protein